MRIIITGATSLIGRNLARKTAEMGWETILVVRPGHDPHEFPADTHVIPLCMEEYDRLGELAGPCDCFVHLAWSGTRGASRMDRACQENNIKYSLVGLRSVLNVGCSRIVLAGSQAEYGPHTEQITEESQCRPNTEYGKFKLALYEQAIELCRGTGTVIMEPRFFSLYGPGDDAGTMIMSTLDKMQRGTPCKLTLGIQMWDFLHINDAVEGITRLCEEDCADGVYNFGSGDVRQLRSYIEEMADITQTKSELQFGAIPYPQTGMVSIWPNISKLKKELQWEPHVTFKEGICSILDDQMDWT